jgi:hypothetical protein
MALALCVEPSRIDQRRTRFGRRFIAVFERWQQPRGPPRAAAKNRENAHDPACHDPDISRRCRTSGNGAMCHLVIIGTDEAAFNRATCQQHQAEEQRNGLSAAMLAPVRT